MDRAVLWVAKTPSTSWRPPPLMGRSSRKACTETRGGEDSESLRFWPMGEFYDRPLLGDTCRWSTAWLLL